MHYVEIENKAFWDRALFFCVLIVAGTLSLWIKASGAAPEPSTSRILWAIGTAVSLQLIYAVIVLKTPRFQLREDRAGDSFYYLGLLLTLISLAHTLWAVGAHKVVDGTHAGSNLGVISGFGIALATTIVGLALRVIVQQFTKDAEEFELDVENVLSQASSELKQVMNQTVADFSTFRTTMQQVVRESTERGAEEAIAAMRRVEEEYVKQFQLIAGRLGHVMSEFSGNADRFNANGNALVIAIEDLNRRLGEAEPPNEIIKNVFEPGRTAIEAVAKEMTGISKAASKNMETGRLAVEKVAELANEIAGIVGLNKHTATVLNESISQMQMIDKNITSASRAIAELASGTEKLRATQEGIVDQMQRWQELIKEVVPTSITAVRIQQEEATTKLVGTLDGLEKIVRTHGDNLETVAARARKASDLMVDQLQKMAEYLEEKLAQRS